MNRFESALLEYWGKDRFDQIRKMKIGIAGAGGLGSNCAGNLVRSGFRKLVICDFDTVEASNLNRQFYFLDQLGTPKVEALAKNLLRINPSLDLEMIVIKIGEDNAPDYFSSCDVVVEAFDCPLSKKILAEAYAATGKFYVSASGIAGWGNSDDIVTRKINGNFHLVGDFKTEATKLCPPCSPRVNIAAAKQADLILAWALKWKG
jgi:sulfur carrier protein ThiS adenylyltransferase